MRDPECVTDRSQLSRVDQIDCRTQGPNIDADNNEEKYGCDDTGQLTGDSSVRWISRCISIFRHGFALMRQCRKSVTVLPVQS